MVSKRIFTSHDFYKSDKKEFDNKWDDKWGDWMVETERINNREIPYSIQ